jgi:hypothetical protein
LMVWASIASETDDGIPHGILHGFG